MHWQWRQKIIRYTVPMLAFICLFVLVLPFCYLSYLCLLPLIQRDLQRAGRMRGSLCVGWGYLQSTSVIFPAQLTPAGNYIYTMYHAEWPHCVKMMYVFLGRSSFQCACTKQPPFGKHRNQLQVAQVLLNSVNNTHTHTHSHSYTHTQENKTWHVCRIH